jgi:hypothetical protein
VHRFYVGKIWTGLLLLLTFGGFGFWWIIDAVLILIGRFKDSQGRVLGPPQYTYRALPSQHSAPPQLTTTAHRPVQNPDDDLHIEDPLEAEFAELERQMKQKGK